MLTEMMEWLTLKAMRTLETDLRERKMSNETIAYLYSIPSLMTTGFFFKDARLAVSRRLKARRLPGGSVADASSNSRTVTFCSHN
jgi:hypothetical protein